MGGVQFLRDIGCLAQLVRDLLLYHSTKLFILVNLMPEISMGNLGLSLEKEESVTPRMV